MPRYFQSRPSAAGAGYDPMASGATNLGPESIVDTPADPSKLAPGADPSTAGFKPSLLTQVCSRSVAIGKLENVDGITSVLHRRRRRRRAVGDRAPRLDRQCQPSDPGGQRQRTVLEAGKRTDHGLPAVLRGRAGAVRPIRSGLLGGSDRARFAARRRTPPPCLPMPSPPALAVWIPTSRRRTPTFRWRGWPAPAGSAPRRCRAAVSHNQHGRLLGFFGEPTVNVVALNLELDRDFPAKS